MTQDRFPAALRILQWALGLVILEESLRFAFSPGAAQAFAKTGMPNFIHLALAWAEIAAAILFLVPRATVVGARFLRRRRGQSSQRSPRPRNNEHDRRSRSDNSRTARPS